MNNFCSHIHISLGVDDYTVVVAIPYDLLKFQLMVINQTFAMIRRVIQGYIIDYCNL